METFEYWSKSDLKTLSIGSRKGFSLERLSKELSRSSLDVLTKSRELSGICTRLPDGPLTQKQLEEFFNRCRKKLSTLPFELIEDFTTVIPNGSSPVRLSEKEEKLPVVLDHGTGDWFLCPTPPIPA